MTPLEFRDEPDIYKTTRNRDASFVRFDTRPECDGQTDGRMDICFLAIPALAYLLCYSARKNKTPNYCPYLRQTYWPIFTIISLTNSEVNLQQSDH